MSGSERLRDGQVFGRYQIVRQIGEGGMGAVYEAVHPALKRRFAIKTLLPEYAEKEEARARFLREGEAASSINHPNVVTVSDVGTEGGIPYLVMEFLEGQSLGDYLEKTHALPVEEAIGLLLPVVSAVATGHDRGVIHRDLKPHNIFLARGHRGELIPKVLDFGVSKVTGEDNALLTRTMTVLGTAYYMSPEQARGARHVDFHSDQYALGLILYEMLTGIRAHAGESTLEVLHNVAIGNFKPARVLRPNLDEELDRTLERILASNPADRYPSLYEVGTALLTFASEETKLTLRHEFLRSTEVVAANDPIRPGTLSSNATAPSEPASGSGPGGTRVLTAATVPAPADDPSDTTLGHAAAENKKAQFASMEGRPRSRRRFIVLGGAVLAAGVVLVGARSGTNTRPPIFSGATTDLPTSPATRIAAPPPLSIPFEIVAEPLDALIVLDDRAPVTGPLDLILPLGGSSHQLRVSAMGYQTKIISFESTERPPTTIRLEREASPKTEEPEAAKPVQIEPGVLRQPGPRLNSQRGKNPSPTVGIVLPSPPTGDDPVERPVTAALAGASSSSKNAPKRIPSAKTKTDADSRKKTSPPPVTSRETTANLPAVVKPGCSPNFVLDAQGRKHFKPDCFPNAREQ